jgi:translation initiation factor 2B subunit (eIF-2B alpha/beta/delta family)
MQTEIERILNDRKSGSIALLNRLVIALEEGLQGSDLSAMDFRHLVLTIRKKLHHFAAIENFLASLITYAEEDQDFPLETLQYTRDYVLYWRDSAGKIAENLLQHENPSGKTILTHSHSETLISLLTQLHKKQIPIRVLQTLSSPGEEGRIAKERMCKLGIRTELVDEGNLEEALDQTDLLLMGCDALLPTEFLNKTGTRAILEQAKQVNKSAYLVCESRKKITNPTWKRGLSDQPLFEWVPLKLILGIVTEKSD